MVKHQPVYAGDTRDAGSVPGPGVGNGHPLQYSCLGNPLARGAWWSQTQLRQLSACARTHTHTHTHTHSKVLTHVIMEAEKVRNLPPASWRLRKAGGIG